MRSRFAWLIAWGVMALFVLGSSATGRYTLPNDGSCCRAFAFHAHHEPIARHRLVHSVDLCQARFSGPIFRLPIASQESLLVEIRGDNNLALQYGVGSWAAIVEQWRGSRLFADVDHAKVLLPSALNEDGEDDYALANDKRRELTEHLVSVRLRDGTFFADIRGLPTTSWRSAQAMRVYTETDADSPHGAINRVEVASIGSTQVREVAYTRGDKRRASEISLTDPAFMASRGANRWIVVVFEPRQEQAKGTDEHFIVIGVLSGKFTSRLDNTFSLQAGEAACLRVDRRANRLVVIQPAQLVVSKERIVLHWREVEQAYEPSRIWLYCGNMSDPKERGDNLLESVCGSIALNPYEMWATQTAIFDF